MARDGLEFTLGARRDAEMSKRHVASLYWDVKRDGRIKFWFTTDLDGKGMYIEECIKPRDQFEMPKTPTEQRAKILQLWAEHEKMIASVKNLVALYKKSKGEL